MAGNTLMRAFGLGVAAGMRSTLPLAAALRRTDGSAPLPGPLARLQSPTARWVLPALAAGELVVDKLPATPARTVAPALLARLASGAIAGAALGAGARRAWAPALAGALGAWLASHALLRLRLGLGRRTGLPDPILGLAEDAAALGLTARLASGYDDRRGGGRPDLKRRDHAGTSAPAGSAPDRSTGVRAADFRQ